MLPALLAVVACGASAQQLATRFSCSQSHEEEGLTALYADSGEFRLDGNRIDAFQWESSLFRKTHGFDCSIDQGDGLQAEVRNDLSQPSWRVTLVNAREARTRRGYDSDHGFNCSVRLERNGDRLPPVADAESMQTLEQILRIRGSRDEGIQVRHRSSPLSCSQVSGL